jgi:P4 family phage/plasmid primase-like protien
LAENKKMIHALEKIDIKVRPVNSIRKNKMLSIIRMNNMQDAPNTQTALNKLFNQYKVGKGQAYTNTSMGSPWISLNIPDDEYDSFLDIYKKCIEEGLDLHLTEKPLEVSPLRIDLDFRFENTNTETKKIQVGDEEKEVILHKYTDKDIKSIVNEYVKILNTYFDVDNIKAYVHEKEYASLYRGKVKDGIHILFPDVLMEYDLQHFVRSKMLESDVFKNMQLCNKIDQVVDEAIIDQNCWLLYGSKKLESQAYKVTKLYSYDKSKNDVVKLKLKDDQDYVTLFSMRNKSSQQNVMASSDEVCTFIENRIKKVDVKKSNSKITDILCLNHISKEENDLVIQLIGCLNKDRAENHTDWMDLGWTLHNIGKDQYLDAWIQFSKQGSSFKPGECEKLWSKMMDRGKGIGSLKYWAKLDNPEKYNKIIEDSIIKYIDLAVSNDGSHYAMAQLISKYKKDELVYDSGSYFLVDKRNIWKEYKDNKAIFMTDLCGHQICTLFTSRAHHWSSQSCREDLTDEQRTLYTARSSKCLALAHKLQDSNYQDNIRKQMPFALQEENFIEKKLDCNIKLFAFNNGVYDLEKNVFRKIEPTDYISINTGYDYNKDVDINIVNEVKDLIQSLFKTEEMYSYVLDVITTVLWGRNEHAEFYILTGDGSNGKSMLVNFIRAVMGGYSMKVNSATFTKKTVKANDTSEMYRSRGIRFINTDEPPEDDELQTARIKEYSGDDAMVTRGLFKDSIEFRPQFKIFISCNNLPKLSTSEDATLKNAMGRRLRIIHFPFTFTENPTSENDKMVNKKLADDIKDDIRYNQAFAKILIDNWNNVKNKTSLNAPLEVIEYSLKFIKESNVVHSWLADNYIYDTNTQNNKQGIILSEEDRIRSRQLYTDFKFETKSSMAENVFAKKLDGMGIKKEVKKDLSYRLFIQRKPSQYAVEA